MSDYSVKCKDAIEDYRFLPSWHCPECGHENTSTTHLCDECNFILSLDKNK